MSELIRDKIMGKEIPLSSIEEQLNKAQDLVILVLSVSKAICRLPWILRESSSKNLFIACVLAYGKINAKASCVKYKINLI